MIEHKRKNLTILVQLVVFYEHVYRVQEDAQTARRRHVIFPDRHWTPNRELFQFSLTRHVEFSYANYWWTIYSDVMSGSCSGGQTE